MGGDVDYFSTSRKTTMGHKARLRASRIRQKSLGESKKQDKQLISGGQQQQKHFADFASACEKLMESHATCLRKNKRVHLSYPDWKHFAYMEALSFLSDFTDKLHGVLTEVWLGGGIVEGSKAITISPESMGFMRDELNLNELHGES